MIKEKLIDLMDVILTAGNSYGVADIDGKEELSEGGDQVQWMEDRIEKFLKEDGA